MNDISKPTINVNKIDLTPLDFICFGNGISMQEFEFDKLDPNLRTVGTNRQWERGIDCDCVVTCDEYQVLYALANANPYIRANLYSRPMYAQKHTVRTLATANNNDIGGSLAIRVAASFEPRSIVLAGYDAHRWNKVDKWVASPRKGHAGPRSLTNWHESVNNAMAENDHIRFIWANTPEEFALYCYA